ncbi:MAG TPA: Holliday junction resolvase RuvX [Anaerolineaceae bacterium]|nr:Holliday junction resolvase RuvX [Anaerolineaceae bacterium]
MEEKGRILAVDPGEKRIGIAVSDLTQTIARPLAVLKHVSRSANAAVIVRLAGEQGAVQVVIGHALNSEGLPGPQARLAERLAEAVRSLTELPVLLWDESGSTQAAQSIRRAMGGNRKSRSGHLDDVAAAVILQSYLDARSRLEPPGWDRELSDIPPE